MKTPMNLLLSSLCALTIGAATADPLPQPQVSFTKGSASTWNADFAGVAQRTYFVQWSLDLLSWNYAPVVEFSSGSKSYGLDTQNAPRIFLRLRYVDGVGITTLQQARDADFDSDGIPNWFEVEEVGSDPLDRMSAGGDSDGDGMPDGWENYYFGGLGIANPNTIQSGDGLTNKDKSNLGLNPNVNYSAASAAQKTAYSYDLVGRLTNVTAPVVGATYTYDEEGNILNAQ